MKQSPNSWRSIALALLLGIFLVLMYAVRLGELDEQQFTVNQPKPAACNTCTPHGYNHGCFNPHKIKRVVAFAIYGLPKPRSKDIAGMIQNLRLMRLTYPGWRMHISIRSVVRLSKTFSLCKPAYQVVRRSAMFIVELKLNCRTSIFHTFVHTTTNGNKGAGFGFERCIDGQFHRFLL